jgi:GAF domain-containing protein
VPNAFGDDDLLVMKALADLIVVVLRDAQLAEQVEEHLAVDQSVGGNTAEISWSERLRQGRSVVYRYADGEVSRSEDLGGAQVGAGDPGRPGLSFPVRVRGRVVGEIKAHKPQGAGGWKTTEVEVMETLIEQLGLALESARLYEEAQRRSTRERQLREIGARMQTTMDLDSIMRTAIEDLAKALDVPSAFVQLYEGQQRPEE